MKATLLIFSFFASLFSSITLAQDNDLSKREVIAEMVVDQAFGDNLYNQFIEQISAQFILTGVNLHKSIAEANRENPVAVENSIRSALVRLFPKKSISSATAMTIAKKMTLNDLKDVLSFCSSSAGRKWLSLSSDQTFINQVGGNIPPPHNFGRTVADELHAAFPNISFDEIRNLKD